MVKRQGGGRIDLKANLGTLTRGRAAATCGVFVLNHKLTTYLLLLLYGVPTALGPFWHSHSTDQPACCRSHSDASPIGSGSSHHIQRRHSGACDCQTPSNQVGDLYAEPATRRLVDSGQFSDRLPSGVNCDGCAICRFYAYPPLLVICRVGLPGEQWSDQLLCDTYGYVPLRFSPLRARGPPLV